MLLAGANDVVGSGVGYAAVIANVDGDGQHRHQTACWALFGGVVVSPKLQVD